MKIRIRRLVCSSCGRIHSELPDIVQPFKHYAAEVIQQALEGKQDLCPAEDSTIHRWISEFKAALKDIEGSLISLWMKENQKAWALVRRVSLLEKIKREHPENWYVLVNRLLVNAGFGTYTRFAFCPSDGCGTLSPTQKRKGTLP